MSNSYTVHLLSFIVLLTLSSFTTGLTTVQQYPRVTTFSLSTGTLFQAASRQEIKIKYKAQSVKTRILE